MLRFLIVLAWWLFGGAVLAGLVLRGWLGDALFVVRYTGYLMPWLLVPLVPGAIWAARSGRLGLAALLGASAAIVVAVHAPLFRPRRPAAPAAAARLKVVSYNTWSLNRDAPRIARVILDARPDVLLLQETEPPVFARLVEALRDLYGGAPVHVAYDPERLQGLVSRYPIAGSTSLLHKGQAQRATLDTPAGPLVVYNVHPLRLGGWQHRYRQVAALLEENVLRETAPVILGGDLNAPEQSQLYRLLASQLANAHREAGYGFGFTYPSSAFRPLGFPVAPPLVRVDHLFHDRRLVALAAGTIADPGGSDHLPVYAELAIVAPATRAGPQRRSAEATAAGTRAATSP